MPRVAVLNLCETGELPSISKVLQSPPKMPLSHLVLPDPLSFIFRKLTIVDYHNESRQPARLRVKAGAASGQVCGAHRLQRGFEYGHTHSIRYHFNRNLFQH